MRGSQGVLLQFDGLSGAPVWLAPAGAVARTAANGIAANGAGRVGVGAHFSGDSAFYGGRLLHKQVPGLTGLVAVTGLVLPEFSLIQGVTFADDNANGVRDAGEPGWDAIAVQALPGPRYFASGADGHYSAAVLPGTYALSVPHPPRHYTSVAVGPATATLSAYGTVSTGHHFAIQPIPGRPDLQLFLTPMGWARPGFPLRFRLTVRNVGTTPMPAPTLRLHHDRELAYDSSSVAATAVDTTLTLTLSAMAPRTTRHVDVYLRVSSTAPLDSLLTVTALVEPLTGDLTPDDNGATATLVIQGAYDPNDIIVNHATLTPTQVRQATRALDYTVRFQNTGTDTAFTVIIRDTLPAALLNLSTLELLSASHALQWRLLPGGVLMVTFPNILLPDSSANEVGSHGFVRFRLVPDTTLVAGDVIPNEAGIYFDFNAPVVTNTALTTVASPTGLAGTPAGMTGGAWPNPATATLHVALRPATNAAGTLTLADALGRVVRAAALPAGPGTVKHHFDLTGLAPGLYVVRAAAGSQHWSQRVVVR